MNAFVEPICGFIFLEFSHFVVGGDASGQVFQHFDRFRESLRALLEQSVEGFRGECVDGRDEVLFCEFDAEESFLCFLRLGCRWSDRFLLIFHRLYFEAIINLIQISDS